MQLMAHYSALAKWLRTSGFKPPLFFLPRWFIKFSFITINEMKAYQLPTIKHQKKYKIEKLGIELNSSFL
jgi:hypothetical protein